MTHIIGNLFLGSLVEASDPEWLMKNNINIVINVAKELKNLSYPMFIESIKISLVDSTFENIEPLLGPVAKYIDKNSHKRILIHCYAGVSRSATIVIYYLMKYHYMDFYYALNFVKRKRPQVGPNSTFLQILLQKNNDRNTRIVIKK